jgi:hypothetical protein
MKLEIKKTTLRNLIWISLLLFSIPAQADGFFRVAAGYVMDQTRSGGGETKETRQLIDFAAGFMSSQGFALFGQYAMEKNQSTSGSTTTEGNRTSYGPGLGWMTPNGFGPYITAAYYMSSNYVVSGTTYQGTGYQVDLGLKIDLSKIFLLAGISYEKFDYPKTSTTTLSPSLQHSHIDPRIGIQFQF